MSGQVFSVPLPPVGENKELKEKDDFEELDLFPITRAAFGSNAQFPNGGQNVTFTALQFKFLKEMKAAISNYGPQSPFVLGLLDSFSSEHMMIPIDWETLGQAVLGRSQWLQLKSWWWEEARVQARKNATRNPPGPTEEQLTGSGQYATLNAQAGLDDIALTQIKALFIKAWTKVEIAGKTSLSFVKILQGATEPYPDFVARLQDAVLKTVGSGPAAKILLDTLAFESANPECQKLLRSLKASGADLAEYIRACAGVGGAIYNAQLFAGALSKALKGNSKQGICYQCGKPGHFKKECQKKLGSSALKEKRLPSDMCKRCGKGRHWTNECRSKTDKSGNVLSPLSGNGSRGPQAWGPNNYNAGLPQYPVSSGLQHQGMTSSPP